ncbi:Ethanolamine ammonia-lyase light chain [Bryocella elongata]|uniref:Ethanolamine ammonia-lyase small subunit n=1 Tax=Bryocella elongata TaxID=863522 RepID=A0A1H6BNK0_9BACT|nr:ethanolamine ammonia-lyase subunit EutC [Bryocella elongata]SEG62278.1 Ethanolamine ammonia-lyase light chain [Bryocella elongata]
MPSSLNRQPPTTTARIALGRTGDAVPVAEHLRFQLDHALARDAVHATLDVPMLERGLRERGIPAITVHSAARDRSEYLRRPDLGRRLATHPGAPSLDSETWVRSMPAGSHESPTLAIILADGLSALAVERHALPLLDALASRIPNPSPRIPVVIATNARVALGDAIGEALGARITVMLIGERPGLSSPDSLGAYLTWNPRPGRADSERNCISNIRAEGLSYAEAAARIAHYLREAQRLHATGIALKDPDTPPLLGPA